MALKKEIILNNGIILNYHRVSSVNNITNKYSIIEVYSYVDEIQRDKEKELEDNTQDDADKVIRSKCYTTEYDKNLNVDNAYEYLKTLEEFEGAEDV